MPRDLDYSELGENFSGVRLVDHINSSTIRVASCAFHSSIFILSDLTYIFVPAFQRIYRRYGVPRHSQGSYTPPTADTPH